MNASKCSEFPPCCACSVCVRPVSDFGFEKVDMPNGFLTVASGLAKGVGWQRFIEPGVWVFGGNGPTKVVRIGEIGSGDFPSMIVPREE